MQKIPRLIAIEKILAGGEISSQEELIIRLKQEGISCTQATLSRNLRQLGVMKVPNGRGGYRYSLSAVARQKNAEGFNIVTVIKEIINSHSLIVIKTAPGHANSVAVVIDNSERYEIAGTIAGDDTLLVIPRNNITLSDVHSCLEMIFPGLRKQVKGDKQK